MTTLAPLQALLENPKEDLEPLDMETIGLIANLVDESQYAKACKMVADALEKGHLDIRLVVYYLYGYFIEQGVGGLTEVFTLIYSLVTEHYERVQPETKRDTQVTKSLMWLFSELANWTRICDKKRKRGDQDPIWQKAIESLSVDDLKPTQAAGHQLKVYIQRRFSTSNLAHRLMNVLQWLQKLSDLIASQAKEEPKEEEVPVADEPPVQEKELPSPEIHDFSQPMQLLMEKLKLFAESIDAEHYSKAALIAKDVSHCIQHFDPVHYFPQLFTQFFSLLATHADRMAVEWENEESLKWQYLQRLYDTDLKAFKSW